MSFRFRLLVTVCFILLTTLSISAIAQNDELIFNHLSVEDGLSQSTIFSIYKDRKGFMWFGTRRGLNRYDGFNFHHYMHQFNDSNSLSSNLIRTIIGDSKDNLVIQTYDDVNYYNRYLKTFTRIPIEHSFREMIQDKNREVWTCSSDGIFKFNEDLLCFETIENQAPFQNLYDLTMNDKNEIWLTGSNQVIRYHPQNASYTVYEVDEADNENFYIECDRKGNIWICLYNGALLLFNEDENKFNKIELNYQLKDVLVSSFSVGLDETIVIGTDGKGVHILNTDNYSLKNYNHQPDNSKSLSSNTYYSAYADDKLKILWLGSYMGGIDYYNKYDKGITFLYHQPFNTNSLLNNNIRSLYYDRNLKYCWVGTRQGISVLDSLNNVVVNFDQEMLYENGLVNPIITQIKKDKNGYVWLCSYKGGIVLYHPGKKQLMPVTEIYPNIDIDAKIGVFDVLTDSQDNIWFATESGTYVYPPNKKGFVFDPDFSRTLLEDRAGRIFVGTTFNGLYIVNNFLQKEQVKLDSGGVYNQRVNALFEDQEGYIWVGTGGKGLFKYNPTNNDIQHFTTQQGLPDNYIAALVRDPKKNIWVSTYSSVAKYMENAQRFKTIFLEKGVVGKEFNPNSIALTNDGIIYIGSINGLLKIEINNYSENPYLPNVIFTDLLINNNPIEVGTKRAPLDQDIMFKDEINLKYNQNSISLFFTAPEYYMGDKVKFDYKIVGQNQDWISLGSNRSLSLVNLNPGEYILKIKATNSDGYADDNGTELIINILPPPWKTVYAYIIYAFISVGLFFMYWKFTRSKLKLKYEVLLQKNEKQKQEEINQTRIRLFTDISHEIGNSLTLLSIPLETLHKIEDDSLKINQLEIIGKNVSRLMLLVKKIIGLRKIETGNMPLLAEEDDIVQFTKSICSNFATLAGNKKISLLYDFPREGVITWFDKEKIEFILFNLLSNAFKYEPEGGKVWVTIALETRNIKETNKKSVVISVNNAGSYIAPENAENIFKRFYKSNDSKQGAGIGLNLIKSYLDIHKGEINLISTKETGVTFEVIIPFGESYLQKNEKKEVHSNYAFISPFYVENEKSTDIPEIKSDNDEHIKVLIVEDNPELKTILRNQLKIKYEVIEAQDGDEGYNKAKSFIPDLIITDYIMPRLDGIELCRAVKNDPETGHIPIVILSAKDDMEDRIKGIEAGADSYIVKPFSINYLNSVIYNLIQLRLQLKNKYSIGSGLSSKDLKITSIDERFLERAYKILDKNIDNFQFGIPEFIEQLGVSKYLLYSKIKELTGQTPNDFITTYKLKKAATIFKTKNIKDTELYYKLGFNNVSYFRKSFKKQYGLTPSQYIKSNKFNNGESTT